MKRALIRGEVLGEMAVHDNLSMRIVAKLQERGF